MLRRTLFFLLFLQHQLWGVCSSLGGGRWHCPDTGNPYTNGASLRTLLDQQQPACGDIIILYAGVEYRSSGGPYYPLRPQQSCRGSRSLFTSIQSSRISEIPENVDASTLSNYSAMMPILSTDGGPIWLPFYKNYNEDYFAGANNYAFRGLLFTTTQTAWANQSVNVLAFFPTSIDYSVASNVKNFTPQDFIVERCIFQGYETGAYGRPTFDNTNGNAFIGSWNQAWSTPATRWLWKNNAFLAYGYAPVGTWHTFSGTAGNPTKLTGSNIQSNLGISYNAGCTSGCDYMANGGTPCSYACARIVMRNAGASADSWTALNGVKYVRARSDGAVDVINPGVTSLTKNHNSSGWGAFTQTGTAEYIKADQQNQEPLGLPLGWDIQIIGNFIDSWGNPIFLGGSSFVPTKNDKVVQAGSTATSIIVDDVDGLYVGQVVIVDAPDGSPMSKYCQSSGTACEFNPGVRSARITAINGNTLSVVPHTFQGIDLAPKVGGALRWLSYRNENVQIRGNMLSNGTNQPSADAGKGLSENKQCINCLFDGNVFGGYLDANDNPQGTNNTVFLVPTSQGGHNPDHTVSNNTYANNIMFSQNWVGDPTGTIQFDQICGYFISSQQPCRNNVMEHNLMIGADVYYAGQTDINVLGTVENNYWQHNTMTNRMPTTASHHWIFHGGCDPFPTLPYRYEAGIDVLKLDGFHLRGNIMGYGNGLYVTDPAKCWSNIGSTLKGNVIVDNNSVGFNQTTMDGISTGNWARSNYNGLFTGTCDGTHWKNCVVSNSDPSFGGAYDGGSPGADTVQVLDHVKGWSEQAGLLVPDMSIVKMVNNPGVFQLGSTRASLTFRLFSSIPGSGCTMELYTDRPRSILHGDTDTAGEKLCSRTGNILQGEEVTFVLGAYTALTPATTYFYKITDGERVMVGEFTTLAAGGADYNASIQTSAADTLTYSANPDLSGGITLSADTSHEVPVPVGTVVYWRQGSAGLRGVLIAQ